VRNEAVARAVVAAGLLIAGALLVAAWTAAPLPGRDWPAMVGMGLLVVGFLTGTAVVWELGRSSSGLLDRLDDRFVEPAAQSESGR
jgi:hypothetical protein